MGVYKAIAIGLFLSLVPSLAEGDKEDTTKALECLSLNIYFEGRNQPWVGKLAIAQVTMNRVFSESFPNTVCEVVLQENMKTCQFSWWCDGKSDTPRNYAALEEARRVAMFVYSNSFPDVTEGALWYHANYIDLPFWAKTYKETVRINDHLFYTK